MNSALVVGAGPAGLMAAEVLSDKGIHVTICDAMPSFGRKFLMAGKSGLNITKDEPTEKLLRNFGDAPELMRDIVKAFDAQAVQTWTRELGQEVFVGPTGRVFPKSMKASPLLRSWLQRLEQNGVERRTRMRWIGWDGESALFDTPNGRATLKAAVTVLALGGASWSRLGSDGRWQEPFLKQGLKIAPFAPSNAAISLKWSDHMQPHFGAPLKAVAWRAGNILSKGEAVISSQGLEGGGIYTLTPALRSGAPLFVDLVPERRSKDLQQRLDSGSEKQRLSHWLRNTLRLPPAKIALFFEMTAGCAPHRSDWVRTVKHLPLGGVRLRPIDEAISTAGGVRFDDLTHDLMLKTRPGVFCAGEMIDWDAPTGGYLITGSMASGRWAAQGALRFLESTTG